MNFNNENKPYLICHAVKYYGMTDEEMFFDWIKKIECIERIDGSLDDLYLHLKSFNLSQNDLYEFIIFFKRYKIDIKQLRPFLNDENKKVFMMRKKAFWHQPLFGKD